MTSGFSDSSEAVPCGEVSTARVRIGRDGRIREADEELFLHTGWQPEEVCGRHVVSLVHRSDRSLLRQAWQRVEREGRWRAFCRIRRRDGTYRSALVLACPLPERGEVVAEILVLENPCHLCEREEAARQWAHRAQRMESVGVLASGLVHDINNALAVILGQGHLLSIHLDPADSQRIETIRNAAMRASALTTQILEMARGEDDTDAEGLLLAPVLREIVRMLGASHSARHTFRLMIQAPTATVRITAAHFHQIASNLCINAVQAMPDGGVAEVRLYEEERDVAFSPGAESGGWVVFEVRDNGTGMDSVTQQHLFQPFYTTKSHGSGLGLHVVHTIVHACGGRIEVESVKGAGTCFRIRFPRAPMTPLFLPAEASWRETAASGSSGTILVIDDNDDFRRFLIDYLEMQGHRTVSFSSGGRVLEYLDDAAKEASAVLLDLALPGASGLELAAGMHERRPGLPIILMSACSHLFEVEGALKAGYARAFLDKPFPVTEMEALLAKVIAENGDGSSDSERNGANGHASSTFRK